MKSERARMSMKYRSEGEEEGLKIRATAEKTRSSILAEAYIRSQKHRGEGEAAAARIYAESLGRGPRFYQFTRSMEAMKKAVDKDTTLVLPVDAELFRLLRDSRAQFAGE
jgi:membrane protease subunit HflC